MVTGTPVWDWAAFAGGSAQGVPHVVGEGLRAAGRVVPAGPGEVADLAGLQVPAGDLLSLLGPVTPQVLNDIAAASPLPVPATAGPAGGVPAAAVPGTAVPAAVTAVPGEAVPGEAVTAVPAVVTAVPGAAVPAVPGEVAPAAVVVGGEGGPSGVPVAGPAGEGFAPAVAVLRLAGVTPGPDAAYGVALHAGMVPVTGEAAGHPGFLEPVTARFNRFAPPPGLAAAAARLRAAAVAVPVSQDPVTPAVPAPVTPATALSSGPAAEVPLAGPGPRR